MNPVTVFSTYPSQAFKQSRWFYPLYDGTWLVGLLLLIAALEFGGYEPPFRDWSELRPVHLLALPVVAYFLILFNVFAHNATHRAFPRSINRLMGEISGMFALMRYASWEMIHLRHHRYSDQPGKDPHDCRPRFWLEFLPYAISNIELQLAQAFYERHGGPTPENVRFQKLRGLLSFGTGVVLAYAFYVLLGPPLFWCVFLPAEVLNILHLIHLLWATHNGASPDRDYRPVNLDHGFYYIGNRIWFGIYYHANHHILASMFNPMRMDRRLAERRRPALNSSAGKATQLALETDLVRE